MSGILTFPYTRSAEQSPNHPWAGDENDDVVAIAVHTTQNFRPCPRYIQQRSPKTPCRQDPHTTRVLVVCLD